MTDQPLVKAEVERRGFVYWPGGEDQPEDWDAGDIIRLESNCRFRFRIERVMNPAWWKFHKGNKSRHLLDIVGYRRTETPMTEPTLRTSAEMLDRMEALTRYIVEHCNPDGSLKIPVTDSRHTKHLTSEAYAIVALLPEPVDPDIQLSRDIAAAACAKAGEGVDYCQNMRDGEYDLSRMCVATLAGIKRGRELGNA